MDKHGQATDQSTAIHVGAGGRVGDITVQGDVAGRDLIKITEELTYDVGDLGRNPYLGLASYTYAARASFGGREQQIQEAVRHLTAAGSEPVLVLVTGASGSGKSSFVQAGLVPALEESYGAAGFSVRWSVVRPGRRPLAALSRALAVLGLPSVPDLRAPEDLAHLLATGTPAGQVSVVVIDQFEELFTQAEPAERDAVCAMLAQVTSFDRVRTHIIATLRADYLPSLFEAPALFERAKSDGIELRAMEPDELARAIRRPLQEQARLEGKDKRVQPALVERLVEDVRHGGPGVLPLVQVTLAALWDEPPHRLTVDRYRSLTDALEDQADRVYLRDRRGRARPTDDQALLMSIFLDLVDVSLDDDAHHDVRRTVPKQELVQGDPRRAPLIEELVEARLLSTWAEQRGSASVELVDIIHETLLTNWPRLRASIHEQRDLLQRRARFRLAVQEWERNAHADEYLFRGARLADALEWRTAGALTPPQHAFLAASQALQEAEQRAARRRVRIAIGTLLGVLVMVSGLAAFAGFQYLDATAATQLATSRELAASALAVQSVDPELSVLLAARAAGTVASQEADAALRRSLAVSALRAVLHDPERGNKPSGTLRFDAPYFSPDGERLLAANSDGAARLWDLASRQPRDVLSGRPLGPRPFSHDGQRILLSAGKAGGVQVWDRGAGDATLTLRAGSEQVLSAAFDPIDDSRIVTASKTTLRIWKTATGELQLSVPLQPNAPSGPRVEFNANASRVLAAGSWPPRAWDANTGVELGHLGPEATGASAAFSADGTRVAIGGMHGSVDVWSVDDGQRLASMTGHTDMVDSIAFSPDGQQVLTASLDDTVRIWDAASGRELHHMELGPFDTTDPLGGAGTHAAFSADGQFVAATSVRSVALQIWDAASGKQVDALPSGGFGFGFSPTGHAVATGGVDVRLWHPSRAGELGSVCCGAAMAALSPDSQRVVTVDNKGVAQQWAVSTGLQLPLPTGPGAVVALGADAQRVLVRSDAGALELVDLSTGQRAALGGQTARTTFFFAHAGRLLGLTTDRGTLRAWDTATGQELAQLNLRPSASPVIVSADGSRMLAAALSTEAAAVQAWQNATGLQVVPPPATPSRVNSVTSASLNGDGTRVATLSTISGGLDKGIQVGDTVTNASLASITEHVGDPAFGAGFTQPLLNATGTKLLAIDNNVSVTVAVWDVANHAKTSLSHEFGHILSALFTPDGLHVVTTGEDSTLRVWDVETGAELMKLNLVSPVQLTATSRDGRSLVGVDRNGVVSVFGCEVMCSAQELLALVPSRVTRDLTPREQQTYLHTRTP